MFWSVVQCETQREATAQRFLANQSFETYLPKIKVKQRLVPLFPSYLFIRIADQWHAVNSTVGVIRLLLAGDHPARLNEKIINGIKTKERNGIVKLPEPKRLKQGDRIKIIRGSFEGSLGVYAGMSGKQRERILLDLLGRQVQVELRSEDFKPLHVA